MRIMNIVLCLAVPAIVVGTTLPASAETKSIRVSYVGLDLSSASGRATLDRRIANAARALCGDPFEGPLANKMAAKACASDAIEGTSKQVAAAVQNRGVAVAAR